MKPGLLEEIKSLTHWRVILRPLDGPLTLTQLDLNDALHKNVVSLRGWNFPHIVTVKDKYGGIDHDGCLQHWTTWHRYREFWRMFGSGQFAWLGALREEQLRHEDTFNKPDGKFIDVVNAIWSITEFFEFAKRMVQDGPLKGGAQLMITLNNAQGCLLWVSEGNRMPFLVEYRADTDVIKIDATLTPELVQQSAISMCNGDIVRFFAHFGWKAPANRIEEDQRRLYEMRPG